MIRNIVFFLGAVTLAGLGAYAFRTPSRITHASIEASNEVPSNVAATAAASDPSFPYASTAVVPRPPPPASSPSEAGLMDQLRATVRQRQPQVILELARQIDRLYPDGSQAEERSLYIIDSLIALDRIPEMRDEARRHLAKWPDTEMAERITARTGVHPDPRPLH